MHSVFNRCAQHLTRRILGISLLFCAASIAAEQQRDSAAPALLLASVNAPHIDPRLYLVSEKYDGVRFLWDGSRLRFRSGRTVPAPAWFLQRLPAQLLDGELWLGRGQFDTLSGIVRSDPPDDAAWRRVQYMVFELPGAPGTFAERAQRIAELTRSHGWPQLQAVAQGSVADRAALQRFLDDTVRAGGEGLMLHLASPRTRPAAATCWSSSSRNSTPRPVSSAIGRARANTPACWAHWKSKRPRVGAS